MFFIGEFKNPRLFKNIKTAWNIKTIETACFLMNGLED